MYRTQYIIEHFIERFAIVVHHLFPPLSCMLSTQVRVAIHCRHNTRKTEEKQKALVIYLIYFYKLNREDVYRFCEGY